MYMEIYMFCNVQHTQFVASDDAVKREAYVHASEFIGDQAFVLGPVTGTSLILHSVS